jgi:GT2 family glycosyltransferase
VTPDSRWSAIVVTQGDRPASLSRAIESVAAQADIRCEIVVVGNGWAPHGLPDDVVTVSLDRNRGAPGGRNRGFAASSADLLFFLDDDAWLPDAHTLAALAQDFATRPQLGVVQIRIAAPDGVTARRWVPRLVDKDPTRSSPVVTVVEGAVAVRREVLVATDGWAGRFHYAHEGIELAWRAWDAGYRVEYRGDLVAHHPLTSRERHPDHLRHDARNRVWLARRNLPWLLVVPYIGSWALVTLLRHARQPREIGAWCAGAKEGIREPAGKRRPVSWRTVWAMSRLGRPPVI